jgi:tripartite-type tricarboxylate transporter receptor subunit TctC
MRSLFAAAILAITTTVGAFADTYPSRPITLVVGFAPGGGVDVVARLLAEQLGKQLGQPLIIANKPGAGGNIAAEMVAKAPPDGYTLFAENLGIVSNNPYLYDIKTFDPDKDFAHLARTVVVPLLMAVPANSPAKTVGDFIKLAKAAPDKLNYGSGGVGNVNHLVVELFASRVGVKMQHIPFRGSSPAITELIAGRIDTLIDGVNLVQPFTDSGELRPLAITSESRIKTAPNIPTFVEAGVPDFVVLGWQGISAPAGLPKDIRDRLEQEIGRALQSPAVTGALEKQGVTPAFLGAAAYDDFIAVEKRRWKKVIQETGVQIK